ncbi:ribosome silencing factor [Deferribacter abyssi]|uniref:ribosome silencing factor n=1 Tax=Deferribacter abyssi TaxID=213806 RepID=UPI003C17A6EF
MENLKEIVKILDDKKGENIVAFNISPVSSLADYMVICTCNSEVHLNAVTDALLFEMKQKGVIPTGVDGIGKSKWVCVDFGDVIVHLMTEDSRSFYDLESIWGDCDRVNVFV